MQTEPAKFHEKVHHKIRRMCTEEEDMKVPHLGRHLPVERAFLAMQSVFTPIYEGLVGSAKGPPAL